MSAIAERASIGGGTFGFSRHQAIGPFYSPREESRLRATPTHLVRTFTRVTRSRLSWAALLMVLGPILVVLDFFV